MKRIEDDLQIAAVRWFKYAYPHVVIIHQKNEGNRKSILMKANGKSYSPDGVRNKKMGVLAGVADLFVMMPKFDTKAPLGLQYVELCGLWLELKAGKAGKQSEAQKAFEVKAKEAGYAYHVVRSIDEFMNICNEYLKT